MFLVDAPPFRIVGLCVLFLIFFFSLAGDFPLVEVDSLVEFFDDVSTGTSPKFSIPTEDV